MAAGMCSLPRNQSYSSSHTYNPLSNDKGTNYFHLHIIQARKKLMAKKLRVSSHQLTIRSAEETSIGYRGKHHTANCELLLYKRLSQFIKSNTNTFKRNVYLNYYRKKLLKSPCTKQLSFQLHTYHKH